MCVSVLDGSTSDHVANRLHIDQLAGLLPPEDDVTFVADCKAFDKNTLGRILDAAFHFVTLVPRTCNIRGQVVQKALKYPKLLPELAREPGRTQDDLDHVYRGCSYQMPYEVLDPETDEMKEVQLRFLAVASEELARKFETSLPSKLIADRKALEKAIRKLEGWEFACEPDAGAALEEHRKNQHLHKANYRIVQEERPCKRPRGRPPAGTIPQTYTAWVIRCTGIEVDEDAVKEARRVARFFVLATDHLDPDKWPDKRILAEYRHQHMIEGHTGFRWLKGPAAACPMFLKTPARMQALGLVFVLALMVRNWIQWKIRSRLVETDETVPNLLGRPTQKPTTENVFGFFGNVLTIVTEVGGFAVGRRVFGLNDTCLQVLRLLGFSRKIFEESGKPDQILLR